MMVSRMAVTLVLADGVRLTILYDRKTGLPRMRAYKQALTMANALSLQGCMTVEVNQNLTAVQKLLLHWHFRLGHIAFRMVQWLGWQGWLGPHGNKVGSSSLEAPKCAACQFSKQGKTPTASNHMAKDMPSALSKEKLEPRQLIMMDQYESQWPGRAFTSKGLVTSMTQLIGGTLFVDTATGYLQVCHQSGFMVAETI